MYKLKVATRDGYRYKTVARIRSLNRFEKIDGIVYQNDVIHRDDFIKSGFNRNISRAISACEARTGTKITSIGLDRWQVTRDVPQLKKPKKVKVEVKQRPLSERIRCTTCKKNYIGVVAFTRGHGDCRSCTSKRILPLNINFLKARKALHTRRATEK